MVEIHEGMHFNIKNASLIINEFTSYFGQSQPYGVVANRVYSYSVDLLNTQNYKEQAKNLYAYGVVGYDLAGKMNSELENDFCISDKGDYDNLQEAIFNVYNKVKVAV